MRACRAARLASTLVLLTGCARGPHADPVWRFEMGEASALEQGQQKLRCSLSISLPDGTEVELGNHFGGFLFSVVRRGATFGEFVPAKITLSGTGETLELPARSVVGGILVAPLSDATDPNRKLAATISRPFRVVAQVGSATVFDGQVPAVPDRMRQGHGLCLYTNGKIMSGQAIIGQDAAGRPTYTIPPQRR